MQNARELMEKHFGYSKFYPMQETIVNDILECNDVLVLMPTGGGKSLCYQLPAIIKDGITVVISPLIALMKDQVDGLTSNGIGASFINSTLSAGEIADVKARLLENKDKILYIAPERLTSPDFMPFLKMLDVGLFAIDEAHCISEWGHDFRPEYRRLRLLRENFPGVPIAALTATAIPDVQKDIIQQLKLTEPKIYKASFNRENLFYYVRPKEDAYEQIVNYIRGRPKDSGIIYCQSRQTVENMAERLQEDGIRALPYHAGMSSEMRTENQERFISEDVEIIVATIAFGMGINKTNVRYVIHYDLPKNIESYYQETGRAGRDGMESDCILFFSHGDRVKIQVLIEKQKNPEKKRIAYKKLNAMINFCESVQCRRKMLLGYFGEEYRGRCGKCDTCLQPRETFDGTETAKKVLGCVQETNQRFGINYVVSILTGKENKRSRLYNHRSLKSFCMGNEYTAKQWQAFIRELVRDSCLDVVGDKYPVLKLNQKSRDILSGRRPVFLTRLTENMPEITGQKTADTDLFNILRSLRKNIADSAGVPPYIIFPDTTLKEMATYYPKNIEMLKKIHGVGQIKLERYGKMFLEKIIDYCKLHNIESAEIRRTKVPRVQDSDTYRKTLDLCMQGLKLEQIAKTRSLAISTIVHHIEKLLIAGENISIDSFVPVEKQKIIRGCMHNLRTRALTPIKEHLGDNYSHDEIRLVRAKSNAAKN